MKKDSINDAMDHLSHDIFPRILPHIFSWKKLYDLKGFPKKILGDGLPTSKGEKWAKMRKLANHVFHGESLKYDSGDDYEL
ncbi:hypothetical protein H5410_036185 [Solanum commersonii]|uniref:Cytochrome P450 n=1 Tax=Solanum commersonii TaxID=4109 RepID=A0A9J5Y3G6_SOLCO|nr:hypothetical protein H5410_036185 [Solanum commersonii]